MPGAAEPVPPTDATAAGPLIAVPNVSEGRDREAIDAIGRGYEAGAASDGDGTAPSAAAPARVLDVHSDPDHHRTVHTLVGGPGALADALVAGAEEAIQRIDLRTPRGLHPHVGALDVCPVVFLDEERRGAAILEALAVGDALGRLGLPVFLYGELGDGRTRADVRRGGVAALTERMAAGELRPDFGPDRPHPTAGAVLVAARPPLLAFNVELAPPATVEHARAIAAAIREGGRDGLPGVRAIGLGLEHAEGLAAGGEVVAQVSCNVEDHRAVPLAELVRAIALHAPVAACEVVGLPPAAAFDGFPENVLVRRRRTVEDAIAAGRAS
jgi:glutamate formiminotransferase/glutamate formiminotransferase/formiminotetrahydrofolate cyclodeaminase